MSRRTQRVSDLIRQQLGDLLLAEVRDPRVQLATVSTVEVTGDLSKAKIRISVLGPSDEDREACVEALQHASGFLRSRLASRLRLRITPELSFELDRGAEHAQKITRLLEAVDEQRKST